MLVVGSAVAQYASFEGSQSIFLVCEPVAQIRSRVETTFNAIGGLLDQLAAVAAAFQGYLRQDLSSGIQLPKYTAEFVAITSHIEAGVRRHHGICENNSERASMLASMMPAIVEHSVSLRSCTFTLKVVSARYSEILGFAEEMAECVNRVRTAAEAMNTPLSTIRERIMAGAVALADMPQAPALDEAFHTEPASMRVAAEEIDRMIARLMSTLQCGDIASQRLDHIGQALVMVDSAALPANERAAFMVMISDQIDHTVAELAANCGIFTENIELIAQRISILVENADNHRVRLAGNYRDLQARLSVYFNGLSDLLRRQGERSALLASGQGQDSPALLDNLIDKIRAAVLDIYYMALNTTLCCGRLGEEASTAAPITTEIRYHISKLADIVASVGDLTSGMGDIFAADAQTTSVDDMSRVLRSESERLTEQVAVLAERSRQAWLSPGRLQELAGAVLGEIPRLHAVADGTDTAQDYLGQFERLRRDPHDQSRRVEELSESIFALYTMNSEREVHKRHFWLDIDSADCDAINLFGGPSDEGDIDLSSVLF